MTTIVLAWKSTRINGLAGQAKPYNCAAVWLNDGTAQDIKNAEKYASENAAKNDGDSLHTVFVFENENKPLERARAALG